MVSGGARGVKGFGFEQHPHHFGRFSIFVQPFAIIRGVTCASVQPQHKAHSSRLAGTVRAQKTRYLAGLYLERDIVYGYLFAKFLPEMLGGDHYSIILSYLKRKSLSIMERSFFGHERKHVPRIGEGFSEADQEKISQTFQHLLPHIVGEYCICGGLATQALAAGASDVAERPFNDIDLVMHEATHIRPEVAQDFFIPHYHPTDPMESFLMVLVDKATAVPVDVFGWERFPPEPVRAELLDYPVYMRSAANQLVVLLSAMYRRITHGLPFIPKQLADAKTLFNVVRADDVYRLWGTFHSNLIIGPFEAWQDIQEHVHNGLVTFQGAKASYPQPCPHCQDADGFVISQPTF